MTIEQLLDKTYAKTDMGKDIITTFRNELGDYFGTTKKFKFRKGEHTASARFYEASTKSGQKFWRIVDFGGESVSPIDLYADERGISYLTFAEKVKRMAAEFGVVDTLNSDVNKPKVEFRPVKPGEADYIYEFMDYIPTPWLSVLGPKVTKEDADYLNWHACKYIGHVIDREKMRIEYSNDDYPILMRECHVPGRDSFFKVYKPQNPEKAFRFFVIGNKPERYVNGLYEFRNVKASSSSAESSELSEEAEERTSFIICSGERDALCVRSMGGNPIWFNSETYNVSKEEMAELSSLVDDIYNIPDLDDTGVRRGNMLALAFPNVKTVWLPGSLKEITDARGRKCKDFRDWNELHPYPAEFKKLLSNAYPARFWSMDVDSKGKWHVTIHPMQLYHFLRLNGFYTFKDDSTDRTRLIRIEGNVVSEKNPKDVRNFVRSWACEHHLHTMVQDALTRTPCLGDSALENLTEVNPDFTCCYSDSQNYYFLGKSIMVTADGIKEYSGGRMDSNCYVWQRNVIQHRFRLLPQMFDITWMKDDEGEYSWDIRINEKCANSKVFKYLINTSRIYWREEENMEPFRIDSTQLTPEQINEQKLNLISKIQGIGYMFHRFKTRLHIWAPLLLDSKIGENGQCNGRSGKSFLMNAMGQLLDIHAMDGRNDEVMKNSHVFGSVKESTQVILFDDCSEKFDFNRFYSLQSEALPINPKGVQDTSIPFKKSPKFCFSSNYVPNDMSSSSEARRFYMVFSDYYHQKSPENDYNETRTIQTDFNKEIFSESYTEEEWNEDINFFMQCLQFYLKVLKMDSTCKIVPPMQNILQRMRKQQMGVNFEEWADIYFAPEAEHMDREISRPEMFQDFMQSANFPKLTSTGFKKKLEAYIKFTPEIDSLNPADVVPGKRIIKRNAQRNGGKAEEFFYIRSTAAAEKMKVNQQMEISFSSALPQAS